MGSGKSADEEQCRKLGCWLALRGVHLLTGAGRGVMNEVSKSFAQIQDRAGSVIGIIPGNVDEELGNYKALLGYPNQWVEIKIYTHLPYSGARGLDYQSRNHINVLSSDVIIVLPGQLGTVSEAQLAIRYNKPIIAWLDNRNQMGALHSGIPVVSTFDQVTNFVNKHLPS